jgi:phage N-6-adenine-methyltransferase
VNRELMFESCGDERATPQAFFDTLNAEFNFSLDAAASAENAKCALFFGTGGIADDALEQDWGGEGSVVWLNPPYSVAGAFVAKAREEADKGAVVVLLLPARTDTKWWHKFVYDKNRVVVQSRNRNEFVTYGDWYPGVECRFIAGRLQFELKVPPTMRRLIKDEAGKGNEFNKAIPGLIELTGLPKMAIEGILADKPDEDLLSSAPFPSCVVVFRRAE